MADVVQYRMERMVPELEDLERRGLFSKAEIDVVVRTRRDYEYRLKRPSPLKSDFLAYIEYEKRLDSLRLLRRKMKFREIKESGGKRMKKSVSDYACSRRIIEIYRMVTTRFKGDVGLWFQYLEYCRQKKNGRLKKALAQALRFHPKIPGLWIYAASWEFDHNLNAAAARAIMQSGLRECPTSEDLWVEYLRMELTYLNKLMARKAELGEKVGSLVRDDSHADDKQWKDEHDDEFMALENENQIEDEELEKNPEFFREQGYNILRTVYLSSIDALPSSFSLRKKFMEILEAIDLAHSEEMQKEILADMKRDFSQDPCYWDWLARSKCSNLDGDGITGRCEVDKAIEVYEEAVSVLPFATMFDLYVKFLRSVIAPKIPTGSNHVYFVACLENVFKQADRVGCLTSDLARQHVSFYLEIGKTYNARGLVEKYTEGKFSDDVHLVNMRLSMEGALVEHGHISDLIRNLLKKASVSDAETLWLTALKSYGMSKKHFNELVEISIATLTRDGGSDDGFSLSPELVKSVFQISGIDSARQLYNRYLVLPRPGLVLYKYCIELETNLATSGDKAALENARKLIESALATYKQDLGLWRDYYCLETKMGTSKTAQSVSWRAQKVLGDSVSLISLTV